MQVLLTWIYVIDWALDRIFTCGIEVMNIWIRIIRYFTHSCIAPIKSNQIKTIAHVKNGEWNWVYEWWGEIEMSSCSEVWLFGVWNPEKSSCSAGDAATLNSSPFCDMWEQVLHIHWALCLSLFHMLSLLLGESVSSLKGSEWKSCSAQAKHRNVRQRG